MVFSGTVSNNWLHSHTWANTDPGNNTVLGVGNRHGVWVQLAGCVIACLGMIYAFYVKPLIKRRNERLVLEEIARAKAEGHKPSFPRHTSESVHA